MLAMMRLAIFAAIGLGLLYVLVSLYSRSVRKEKLEERADALIDQGDLPLEGREAYIEDGLEEYRRSFRRKMIAAVVIAPVLVIAAVIYITNFL